jgi:hypothetical protein
VLGFGLDGLDSLPGKGKIFLFPIASRLAMGVHQAHYLMDTREGFPSRIPTGAWT